MIRTLIGCLMVIVAALVYAWISIKVMVSYPGCLGRIFASMVALAGVTVCLLIILPIL